MVLTKGRELDAAEIERRLEDNRIGLPLVLVGAEVEDLVADNRPTDRATDLLVRERQHTPGDWIFCIELVVAEVAVEATRRRVRASPGHRLHLHPNRASLRDVEHVRDDLILGDRFTAQTRLP